MAQSTFDSTKMHLESLLSAVDEGRLQLPEFQRGWVWEDERIVELLASVAAGYPIGAVMLMETGGEVQFKARPVARAEPVGAMPEQLILDGQQRLTSMYQSLLSSSPVLTKDSRKREIERWYYIDIEQALEPDADLSSTIRSIPEDRLVRTNFGRDIVLDLTSREKEFEERLFPLNRSFDAMDWRTDFAEYHDHEREVTKLWNEFEKNVLSNFDSFQLPVITLRKDTSRDAVCLVFEKVNTGGVALDVFELLTASFAAAEEGFNLREEWKARQQEMLAGSNQKKNKSVLGGVTSKMLLQIITLLATRERHLAAKAAGSEKPPAVACQRRDLLRLEKEHYDRFVQPAVNGLIEAARFLHGEYVFENRFLPYNTQLVPLAALFAVLGVRAQDAGPRDKLRQWFWCGVFGELYGSSTESRFANDLAEVEEWIDGGQRPSTVVDANLAPERLERLRTRNSAAYRGLYVLLLREGAKDWRTGEDATLQNYHDENVDIHHVFPRKWCRTVGLDDDVTNSIINKTPLTARTNRIIGGDAPSHYLDDLVGRAEASREVVDGWIESHLIEPEALATDDFETFWYRRRASMLEAVSRVMGKDIVSDGDDALVLSVGGVG